MTLLLLLATPVSAVSQQYPYALFELPPLDNNLLGAFANGINERGTVVGAALQSSGLHATIWENLSVVDLGTFGADAWSSTQGNNDLGDIVGWSGQSSFRHDAILWRNGKMFEIGTLGGDVSDARSINDEGLVVGWSEVAPGGYSDAFVWEKGETRPLPGLVQPGGRAYAINNIGEIAGSAFPEFPRDEVAVVWRSEQITELPTLDGRTTVAFSINDLGQIVGHSKLGEYYHAVAWVNDEIFDLHPRGVPRHSAAFGINNNSEVVGYFGHAPLDQQAFIWDQVKGMRLLDKLVPPRLAERWSIYQAYDINDAGQIAAYGAVPNRPLTLYAFLVNPVYPSLDLAPPSPGRAGTSNMITISNVTPGATVQFVYSRHGGGTRIPGCDLQQNALQLDNPTVIGTAIANQQGVATITRPVPLIARGQTILFQAVVQGECAISQLVVWRFE